MKIRSILTTYYLQTKRNLKRCNLGHILNFLPCFLGETENPRYFPSHLLLHVFHGPSDRQTQVSVTDEPLTQRGGDNSSPKG